MPVNVVELAEAIRARKAEAQAPAPVAPVKEEPAGFVLVKAGGGMYVQVLATDGTWRSELDDMAVFENSADAEDVLLELGERSTVERLADVVEGDHHSRDDVTVLSLRRR